jgi:MATE family, multidrug efflux pump
LKTQWNGPGGYREVLVVAIPLILSTASWSVQHFVDRMFLTWYAPEAIAAAMPAGMLQFSLVSIFMGTAGYVSTFVAQYYGAKKYQRIGPAIWQGIYISLIGGVVLLCVIPFGETLFNLIGHDKKIRPYEIAYFKVLCWGAGPYLASYAISGFFSGRGRTWPVMWVNTFTTAVNLILDYMLIFGRWGMPEMGIRGAGLATVIAGIFSLFAFLVLIASEKNNTTFATLRGWRYERNLFFRVLRFGLPSGIQFFLEMAGFTGFVLIVGRLGTASLAATNIAFNINTLAFMPMIGCGIAISVLVGQYLGADKPETARVSAYSGFYLSIVYMGSIALAYVLIPDMFVAPFALKADPVIFQEIYGMSVVLLRFVAIYSLFDTLNIVFASAIKGAGDTRFVMFTTTILSLFVLILPTYVAVIVFDHGLMTSWIIATIYVSLIGIVYWLRFLNGKWLSMRVIESAQPAKSA